VSRDLVDAVESGVYIVQSRKFVYVNPFFLKLTGYSREELIGTRSFKLVLPQDRPTVRKKATRNLKSHAGSKPYEYRFIKKGGETIWVMERVSTIEYMGKKAALGSFVDITGRKRLEEALAHSEATYRTILEQMYDSYYEVDLDGNFTFVNDSVCRNLGYSSEEMVGQSYRFTTPPDDVKPLLLAFNEVFSTGLPNIGFAHGILRKDGSKILVESSISLRKNEQGGTIGFRSVSRDISERKHMEDELQKLASVVRHSSELVNLATPQGKMLFLNEAGVRMLGIDPKEIDRFNFMQVIPDHLKEHVQSELLPALMQGATWEGDLQYLNLKTGQLTDVHAMTFAIKDPLTGAPLYLANVSLDITRRKRTEEALKDSDERYRALFDRSLDLVYVRDLEGNFIDANSAALNLLGYRWEDIPTMNFASLLDASQFLKTVQILNELKETGFQKEPAEFKLKRRDGTFIYVETQESVIYRDGKPHSVQGVGRDITGRKNAEAALKKSEGKFRSLVENINDVFYRLDGQGIITYVSPVVERLSQYKMGDLIGKSFIPLVYPDDLPALLDSLNRLVGGQEEPWEFRILDKDGKIIFVRTSSRPIYEDGQMVGVTALMTNITERKHLEQKLEEMATHDFLTGLPNRVLLLDRFNIAAALAHRNKVRLAVMSLDLDRFKTINDTLGHDAGDYVLKAVSKRLTGIIRASDTLARIGGDEFILVMLETNQPDDATAIAQKILDSFAEPISIDGHQVHLSTSIGIAIYPDDAGDMETLTKKSDAAMYYSKGHGRNRFKFFKDGDVRISGDHRSTN